MAIRFYIPLPGPFAWTPGKRQPSAASIARKQAFSAKLQSDKARRRKMNPKKPRKGIY